MEFTFDREENKENINKLEIFLEKNKDMPGILMPALQEVQSIFGYLPTEMLQLVSRRLGVPMSEIYGVATFYSQFSFVPTGDNIISVCLGTACYVKGAHDVMEEIEGQLGIAAGNTTPDLQFTISSTRCIGDCSLAPVILVNEDVYPHLKTDDIKDIIDKYRK